MQVYQYRKAYKLMVVILITISVSGAAVFGFNSYQKQASVKRTVQHKTDNVNSAPDPALVAKFMQISERMLMNEREFLLSGKISIQSALDTIPQEALDYIFSRKDEQFYYRMGHTETINKKNLCVFIDHRSAKILISPGKSVAQGLPLPDPKALAEMITTEGYLMKETVSGNLGEITISNLNHPTCKSYKIRFDSTSLVPKGIDVKVLVSDANGAATDQLLSMVFEQVGKTSAIKTFNQNLPVEKRNGHWILIKKFKDYELIDATH